MLELSRQTKTNLWTRPSHRAVVGRGHDERAASWKALLPHHDDARVLAVDVDAATFAALSRNFHVVDRACHDVCYDMIVRGLPGNDALIDRLAPGGVWVDLTAAPPKGLSDVRRYALLPSESPRVIIPLGPRRSRSAGLRFHRPSKPHARMLASIAAKLSDLGMSRHLGAPGISIGRREGASKGTTLAQWLSTRIGRPVDDIVIYTGSDEAHRKITALAIGPADTADIVVKLADTEAAAQAIDQENKAIHVMAMSSLVGCAPRPICVGTWGGYRVSAQSILRGRASELVLTDEHMAWLGRMSRIEPKELPLSSSTLWKKTQDLRRGDLASELADLDTLDGSMTMACHMTHGDFAPWNLQRRGNLVLAVDWEDADQSGLACTDAFHFLFRTASNVGPWRGGRIMAAQMAFAGAQLGATAQQINAVMRLWLAHEAWSQPGSRDQAVETLAHL